VSTAVGLLPPLSNYDRYRTLGEIRGHTIVVSRGADILTPPAHSRDLAAGIPGAVHVHLPNAAHAAARGVLRHSYLQRFVFRRHRPFEVTLSGYAPHRLLVSIRDQRTNVGRPGGCRRPGLHIGHLFAQQFALAGYEVRAWSPTGSAHTLHDRQSLSTLAEIGRPGVSGSKGAR
jgi:hypothetical protein